MLIRNPYERLVSGFLNKYVGKNPEYKNPPNCNCFYDFCNILERNPEKIDRHHFQNQTSDKGWKFYNELGKPKIKYLIETPDVNNVSKILGLNINELKENSSSSSSSSRNIAEEKEINLWKKKYNYFRKNQIKSYSMFYNNELKNLVYKIYENDFLFFNSLNINYTI